MTTSSDRPSEQPRDAHSGLIIAPAATPALSAGRPWHVGAGTGLGPLPGVSPDESARMVAGELPDLPHLVELPDRGVGADLVGRTIGMLVDIFGEVVPSGWRVTRRPGRDMRRANDFLEWDLDAATEHYAGADWVKVQASGPWTVAAELELGSGNRALTDPGAVDDIAASLTQGLLDHLDLLSRRLPGTRFVVQLDEPLLPQVIAGALATPSGFGSVRAVDRARVGQVLRGVTDALVDVPTIGHCHHSSAPLRLLGASGFDALFVDFTDIGTSAARLDPVGELVEAGTVLLAGLVPVDRPIGREPALARWAKPVLDVFDRLGFPRHTLSHRVVPAPVSGLADADDEWTLTAVTTVGELARAFEDLPEGW